MKRLDSDADIVPSAPFLSFNSVFLFCLPENNFILALFIVYKRTKQGYGRRQTFGAQKALSIESQRECAESSSEAAMFPR
jgi:hypothetical protein